VVSLDLGSKRPGFQLASRPLVIPSHSGAAAAAAAAAAMTSRAQDQPGRPFFGASVDGTEKMQKGQGIQDQQFRRRFRPQLRQY